MRILYSCVILNIIYTIEMVVYLNQNNYIVYTKREYNSLFRSLFLYNMYYILHFRPRVDYTSKQ